MFDKFDNMFIEMANTVSKLSNCVSHRVGAVLVKDQRPISIGYNGSPPGHTNCNHKFNSTFDREEHHIWSKMNEIHAEMNLLGFASKNGISTNDCTIYCTLQPCNDCLRNICAFGIKRIVYEKEYDKCSYSTEVLKMLNTCNIELVKYEPNTL